MNKGKAIIISMVTLLITAGFCILLFFIDNKYTDDSIQPINGILYYEETGKCTYLIRQWMIYPDILLSPDDIADYDGYRYYGDIGGKRDYHSDSLTYRLIMMLPETQKEYALELPEIFSACELYINGKSILKLGDPSTDYYKEGIGSRVVTFTAGGETEIILNTTDRSGILQGMVYPPAFGTSTAVISVRESRLIIHTIFVLLALSCLALAIGIAMQKNKLRGILTLLLCISLVVTTGYPIYHGFFITSSQPWYTLEPLCFYMIMLLALLLYGNLFEISWQKYLLIASPCMLGALFTLIRFAFASLLPTAAAEIFSMVSLILKYYTAISLIILGFWALYHRKYHSLLLLCGALAFGTCLICDRLLPLYEPIYGGWFGEIGGVMLAASIAAALWIDTISAYRFRLTYETNLRRQNNQLEIQKEHYEQLSHQIRLAREASHDLRHHMRTLRGLAEQEKWEHLVSYLDNVECHAEEKGLTIRTEHPSADAVLHHYSVAAQKIGADYDAILGFGPDLSFPDDELCVILSNLLENAVDAVAEQKNGEKQIYLRGNAIDGRLGIVAENTFSNDVRKKDGRFISTKHNTPSFGLSSVNSIVDKYNGLIDIETENGIFRVMIMIPLPKDAK